MNEELKTFVKKVDNSNLARIVNEIKELEAEKVNLHLKEVEVHNKIIELKNECLRYTPHKRYASVMTEYGEAVIEDTLFTGKIFKYRVRLDDGRAYMVEKVEDL